MPLQLRGCARCLLLPPPPMTRRARAAGCSGERQYDTELFVQRNTPIEFSRA